jgi:hypothetical protein
MIPSQLFLGLTPLISGEAAHTKFLVFDFTMGPPFTFSLQTILVKLSDFR